MSLHYSGRVARIYWEELLFVGKGMALWSADPFNPVDQYTEVKPGDIGYIDDDGMFIKKKNFWDDRTGPTQITKNFDAPNPLTSKDINKRDWSVDGRAGHAGVEGSVGGSAQSEKQHSASLELVSKYGTSFDLEESCESELRQHFEKLQNVDNVLEQTKISSMEKLVIVTGCTLTGDWKAEVHDSGTSGASAQLGGGVPLVASGKGSISYSTSHESSPLKNSGHHHPGHRGNVDGSCCSFDGSCCQAKHQRRNQCIFIRSWRVRKRRLPLPGRSQVIVMKAAAEPKDPDVGESDDNDDAPPLTSGSLEPEVDDSEVAVERYPQEVKPPPTYYDQIFDFLFENSVAEVALVHDRHVPRWIAYKRDSTTILEIVTNTNASVSFFRDPVTVFLNPDTLGTSNSTQHHTQLETSSKSNSTMSSRRSSSVDAPSFNFSSRGHDPISNIRSPPTVTTALTSTHVSDPHDSFIPVITVEENDATVPTLHTLSISKREVVPKQHQSTLPKLDSTWHSPPFDKCALREVLDLVGITSPSHDIRDVDSLKTFIMHSFSVDAVKKGIRNLRERDAVLLEDLLEALSSQEPEGNSDFAMNCQSWVRKVARASEQFPSTMFISEATLISTLPCGGGGSSDIYRGIVGSTKVAIKVPRIFRSSGREFQETMQTIMLEALIWHQVSHPRIVPFLGVLNDIEVHAHRTGLVSVWMENGDISTFLGNHVHIETPLSLMKDVMEGLQYLHSHGFTHGDIKPSNILVDDLGHASLSDLGLSRSEHTTQSFKGIGTARYLAPELLSDSNLTTESTDIYAFGLSLYEVLSGRLPFHEVRNAFLITSIVRTQSPKRPLNDESRYPISDVTWRLMECCWNHSPSSRPSADSVLQQLQDIIALEAPSPGGDSLVTGLE